jgi:hypothetical protein
MVSKFVDGGLKRKILLIVIVFACLLQSSPVQAQDQKSSILTAERINETITMER